MFRHFVPSRWLHPRVLLVRLSPVDLSSANGFGKPFAASKLQKSMMEVLNLKRAAKIVLIGVCFGLILLFLKISFRIDDAAFMHGYWIAAVEITPSRVPTVAIVIPEVSTDTVTLETVSTILSFLLSVCLFSLYRSVNRIA